MKRLLASLSVALALIAGAAPAVEPDEMLADPALEARARDLSTELRCVVCQNENIDSSNAGVARDLRLLVRERLVAGDSDKEVLEYVVARYGDFVLFRPPWKPITYALWLAPALIFLGGAVGIAAALRRRRGRKTEPLTEQELAEIDVLMGHSGKST